MKKEILANLKKWNDLIDDSSTDSRYASPDILLLLLILEELTKLRKAVDATK
tara:strand:- start:276 stop:431 length:156 start_codon:yes stop_codon:yes gene_type:complete